MKFDRHRKVRPGRQQRRARRSVAKMVVPLPVPPHGGIAPLFSVRKTETNTLITHTERLQLTQIQVALLPISYIKIHIQRTLTGRPAHKRVKSPRLPSGDLAQGGPVSLALHKDTTRTKFSTPREDISPNFSGTAVMCSCKSLEELRWCPVRRDLVVPYIGILPDFGSALLWEYSYIHHAGADSLGHLQKKNGSKIIFSKKHSET